MGNIAVKRFIIYELHRNGLRVGKKSGSAYKLERTVPHTDPFADRSLAEQWIQDQGKINVNYTVLEVFSKSL